MYYNDGKQDRRSNNGELNRQDTAKSISRVRLDLTSTMCSGILHCPKKFNDLTEVI